MQYRKDKYGNDISALAYGCMRFSKNGSKIDLEKTEKEILAAIDAGVNYFDTAYIYPGSEVTLGEILEKNNCRDKVYIATKLPHYLIKSMAGLERTFQEQLKRLRTDHIDYYLMHVLTDVGTWNRLVKMGIEDWIQKKKEAGQIRNIGFSYHGNSDMFCQLVDVFPWDFCMIQYNYQDEHSQAGRRGLLHANAKGMPVMIMEPLRGGRLVNLLPDGAKKLIAEHEKGYSAAEWSLRWLWNQAQVTSVLSGLNDLALVEENCRIASEAAVGAFGEEDFAFIEEIKKEINRTMKVGCTGCGYCMPCPKGVDIPGAFSAWNMYYAQDKKEARKSYMRCSVMRRNASSASQCIGCGKCESHCPQDIAIRKELQGVAADMENIIYKGAKFFIRLLRLW